jgi:MFS transporter, MHS family, citrate/tricarballylate:H+ symporter
MPEKRVAVPPSHVAAVVAGNTLEFYDFITYSFFAVYIGRAFFPSNDPTVSLLASLGTFGAGFVTRPIGSYAIGRIGDHRGRKPAMILSFSLMGLAIVGLAAVPSYARIGVLAPALVIFLRMLQGFALGGDVGPTTALMLEAAPLEWRGFYSSFQSASQSLATLAAGLAGFFLANLLNEKQLQDFGWRIAFLIGAAIVPFGLLLRGRLPETFHAEETAEHRHVAIGPYLVVAILGVLLLANATIATYIRNYMTTYALATLHMASSTAFAATVVNGLAGTAACLAGGALSDRFGRKAVMIVPGALLLALILPTFFVIAHYRSAATLLGAAALFSILSSMSVVPMITWLTESLPAAIRSSGLGIVYAVSIATFGGSAQYVVTWLIKVTGNPLAPAWYWTIAAIVGLGASVAARESAPRKVASAEIVEPELSEA